MATRSCCGKRDQAQPWMQPGAEWELIFRSQLRVCRERGGVSVGGVLLKYHIRVKKVLCSGCKIPAPPNCLIAGCCSCRWETSRRWSHAAGSGPMGPAFLPAIPPLLPAHLDSSKVFPLFFFFFTSLPFLATGLYLPTLGAQMSPFSLRLSSWVFYHSMKENNSCKKFLSELICQDNSVVRVVRHCWVDGDYKPDQIFTIIKFKRSLC